MNKCSLSKGASDSKMKQFIFVFLSSLSLFNDSQNALENDITAQLSKIEYKTLKIRHSVMYLCSNVLGPSRHRYHPVNGDYMSDKCS